MTRNTGQAGVRGMVAAAGVLAIVLWGIYGRALDAPFVFDDRTSVLENDSITKLWPLVGSDGGAGTIESVAGDAYFGTAASEFVAGDQLSVRRAATVGIPHV